MAKEPVTFQLSAPAILAFPNLLVPRKFMQNGREQGEAKFDATLLLKPDHPDIEAIKSQLNKAALGHWPGGLPQPFSWPLRSGDAMADSAKSKGKDREVLRGFFVLQGRSQFPPGLSAVINGRVKDYPQTGDDRATAQSYFYGGCECLGGFVFEAYEVGANTPGVTAYLQVLISLNRGEHNAKLTAGASKSGSQMYSAEHLGKVMGTGSPLGSPATSTAGISGLL